MIERVTVPGVEDLMCMNRRWKILGALFLTLFLLGSFLVWNIGSVLMAPANHPIGAPPASLHAEPVEFPSASGAQLHGWRIAGQPGKGVVVLLHGIHANRRVMVERAKFLSRAGYSVLLFDFQAHGESVGRQITFGYLESRDATAAVDFARATFPGEKIGVIGVSLGGAAALLASPPLPVQALVLESVFPTLWQATEDRMIDRFGFLGRLATPLLTVQLKPRLGIGLEDLRPIACAAKISAPKFFIAGAADRLTTAQESRALYAAAAEPKQFWLIDKAAHVDLHAFAGAEYETRILEFFGKYLP